MAEKLLLLPIIRSTLKSGDINVQCDEAHGYLGSELSSIDIPGYPVFENVTLKTFTTDEDSELTKESLNDN